MAAVALSLTLVLCSCASDGPDPTPQPRDPVERAVLVYMAARNSLGRDKYDRADIAEMERAVRSGNINPDSRLIIYHADVSGSQTLVELTTRGRDTLKVYDSDRLSVSVARMREVIDDVRELSPASRYGLILWSHGNGWLQNGIAETLSAQPKSDKVDNGSISLQSWGEESGRTMNITSLADALAGSGFDYVYFDCCYMASVEVAYELRHVTPYIVGSAIELPAEGMPYDRTLKYLTARDADLVGAATTTFEHYDAMTGSDRTCAISVIATAPLDRLAEVSHRIVSASGRATPADYRPQRFQTESSCRYFDMKHYYDAMALCAGSGEDLMQEWNEVVDECVIYKASTPYIWGRLPIDAHCGLSTYILPPDGDPTFKGYDTLSWYARVIGGE